MTTHALGTVEHRAAAGTSVAVVLPSGHKTITGADGGPIYAGEDLVAGQRVMWASWLTGNAVVSVDTERELPQVNADLAAANAKLDGDRLDNILHKLLADHPMWIDDGNNPLTGNPTRDVLIDDFVESAVRAIQAPA